MMRSGGLGQVGEEQPHWEVGDKIWVEVFSYDAEEREAIGRVQRKSWGMVVIDELIVALIKNVFSQAALRAVGRLVPAEIISQRHNGHFLVFECSSKYLMPSAQQLVGRHTIGMWSGEEAKIEYHTVLQPHLAERGETCAVCLEDNIEVLYSGCSQNLQHAACLACQTEDLRQKLTNISFCNLIAKTGEEKDKIESYNVCVKKALAPSCFICRSELSLRNKWVVQINGVPAQVEVVDYFSGGKVAVQISDFDDETFEAIALLSNGTEVTFENVQRKAARRCIRRQEKIEATILAAVVQNGTYCLFCSSEALPEREVSDVEATSSSDDYYSIGDKITVQISEFNPRSFEATAILSDGTQVLFRDVQIEAARRYLRSGEEIEATISGIGTLDGASCFLCSSEALPERHRYVLGEEIEFTIERADGSKSYESHLPSGEVIQFITGLPLLIGDHVKAFVSRPQWNSIEECLSLGVTMWKPGQEVDVNICGARENTATPNTLWGGIAG